jgi:hypothetical protein
MSNRGQHSKRFDLTPWEPEEHALQIDCTTMLKRILLPQVAWTAIDHAHSFNPTIGRNGKPIGLMEMVKRKARGIRAGLQDYSFWHSGLGFAIELKKSAAAPLSNDQKIWLRELQAAEVPVRICWTIDQVFWSVDGWGLVRPGVRLAAA